MLSRHHLISHALCPYVQRVAITAAEKGVALDRTDIDLSDKPEWFLDLSPTGKTPVLSVVDANHARHALFESAAICEYLDETGPAPRMLPADPVGRARHRAWIEFASGVLGEIAGLYSAPDQQAFNARAVALRSRFVQVEKTLEAPWFGGETFGLADAAFAPVFRYLDVFEERLGLSLIVDSPKTDAWRLAMASRLSVAASVSTDFPDRLYAFLKARPTYMGRLARADLDEANRPHDPVANP